MQVQDVFPPPLLYTRLPGYQAGGSWAIMITVDVSGGHMGCFHGTVAGLVGGPGTQKQRLVLRALALA